jgi:L-ribulose-5-phosphate 3-epimerase
MKNKICVITSTYANFNVEEALDGISKSGFKFVELINVPNFATHISLETKDIKQELNLYKKYGVELLALGAGYGRMMKDDTIINFKKVIDAAQLLGVKVIDADTGEVKNKKDEEKFYKDIKTLGDYASTKDVTICLELHGDWCTNGKIAAEIVKKINHPNVKITYDTGNSIFYGDTRPEDDIKYAIPHMGNLHIKDKRGGYKVWDFPALGEGDVDFDKIFSLLKNYTGPMSVEVELDGKKNFIKVVNDAVKRSYDFLKGYSLV